MTRFLLRLAAIGLVVSLASFTGAGRAVAGVVTPYPRVPGDASNADFPAVNVNGVPVETCGTVMNVGYAHFAFSGTAKVEITAREAVESFDLSPHRAGIAAKAEGNMLSFELAEPRKLHVQVNKLSRFFLFAEAPEVNAPKVGAAGVSDLTKFGVVSSPDGVQTAGIQKAIDEVAAKRGTLVVPPGIYRTGELWMKSNLTLYLAPGAVVKGTGKLADHPVGEFGTQLIYFLDCENVRVYGRGVIDGQGQALRIAGKNSAVSRMKLVRSLRARNIVVEDVILRDSGTWGAHLIQSEELRFSGCKLISTTKYDVPEFPWETNTDGFDPDNSSHVLIERCFISSNDDSIAVKLRYGVRRDVRDIVFRDNVVWTVKSALKLGSELYDRTISDVRFENNDVIRADRGIVASAYCGATLEKLSWTGNYFEFIGGDIKPMLVELKIQAVEGKGRIRDVLIQNNTFEREAAKPSRLQGLGAENDIAGVTFDNFMVAGRKRLSAEEAGIEVRPYVSGVVFR